MNCSMCVRTDIYVQLLALFILLPHLAKSSKSLCPLATIWVFFPLDFWF